LGVGVIARGAEVTSLGTEIFATELIWCRRDSYLSTITGGAELGASCCGAEVLEACVAPSR